MLLELDAPLEPMAGGTDPWVPVAAPPEDAPLLPPPEPPSRSSVEAAIEAALEAAAMPLDGTYEEPPIDLSTETVVALDDENEFNAPAGPEAAAGPSLEALAGPEVVPPAGPSLEPPAELEAAAAPAVRPDPEPPFTAIPSGTSPSVPVSHPPTPRQPLLALPMLPPVESPAPPAPPRVEPPAVPTPASEGFTPIRSVTAPWLTRSDLQAAEQAEAAGAAEPAPSPPAEPDLDLPVQPVAPAEPPPEAAPSALEPPVLTPPPRTTLPWLTLEDLGSPALGEAPEAPPGEPSVPLPWETPTPEAEPIEPAAPPAPPDRAAELLSLVRENAAAGDRRALWQVAEEAEAVLGAEALRPWAAQLGRAALEAKQGQAAHRWLSLARQDDPEELTIARDLSRAAERTGRHAEEVALGELCADAIAPHDPLAAAARYRYLAGVLADKVGDPAAAASLVEKALTLSPQDDGGQRELWRLWARRPATAGRALEGWLEAARRDPADAVRQNLIAVAISDGAISLVPLTSAGLSGSAGSAAIRSHSTRSAD
jgi:hypothetical protein